jgi:transketolase
MDLRKQFFSLIFEKAKKDKKIIVLLGDLGFSFCEKFQKELPAQILNVGCIEQSMVGIAAGMAETGMKPYVYSNAVFLLSRANEQVRDDIAFNKMDVKLIGTGAAGFLGFSHNLAENEDKNLIRHLPIKSYWPKNEKELKKILFKKGCAYIKI